MSKVETGGWNAERSGKRGCRVVVAATELNKPQVVQINGNAATLTPAAPRAMLDGLGNLGTDYPTHSPADGRVRVAAPGLTANLSLEVTVVYFPQEGEGAGAAR